VLDAAARWGDVPATRQQLDALGAEVEQAHRAVDELDALIVEVATSLRAAGVDLRVLKGPAVARLDLPDRRHRSYADVDILVRGEEIASAVAVLGSLGFRRDLPERRPGFDRRFTKEVSLAAADGREIDVHRLLAVGAVGAAMDLTALWSSSDEFAVEGTPVAALDAEGRFAHACVNAALGDPKPRLVALRDAVLIARARALDPQRVAQVLSPGRGAAVIERTRAHAAAMLGVDLDFPVGAPPSRWERAALRCYRAQGGSNALELLSGAIGLRGVGDRVAYLAVLAFPSAPYRRARVAAGRPRELVTAVGELVSRRKPPVSVPADDAPSPRLPAMLPARRAGLGVVGLDGQTVVWDPESGRVTRLDGIASLVWEHLDESTTIAELVDDLTFAFAADRAVVDADVGRLVTRFVAVGIAEWTRMESWTSE
jgi:hypothetical protein